MQKTHLRQISVLKRISIERSVRNFKKTHAYQFFTTTKSQSQTLNNVKSNGTFLQSFFSLDFVAVFLNMG